jgi:hypothetical protein
MTFDSNDSNRIGRFSALTAMLGGPVARHTALVSPGQTASSLNSTRQRRAIGQEALRE